MIQHTLISIYSFKVVHSVAQPDLFLNKFGRGVETNLEHVLLGLADLDAGGIIVALTPLERGPVDGSHGARAEPSDAADSEEAAGFHFDDQGPACSADREVVTLGGSGVESAAGVGDAIIDLAILISDFVCNLSQFVRHIQVGDGGESGGNKVLGGAVFANGAGGDNEIALSDFFGMETAACTESDNNFRPDLIELLEANSSARTANAVGANSDLLSFVCDVERTVLSVEFEFLVSAIGELGEDLCAERIPDHQDDGGDIARREEEMGNLFSLSNNCHYVKTRD